jgi:hypothetical protein
MNSKRSCSKSDLAEILGELKEIINNLLVLARASDK